MGIRISTQRPAYDIPGHMPVVLKNSTYGHVGRYRLIVDEGLLSDL
jgi:hypothetical protein